MRRNSKPIIRHFNQFPGDVWGETVRLGGISYPVLWYNRAGRKLTTAKARANFLTGKVVIYRVGGSYGGAVAYDPRGMTPHQGGAK